ncbi:TBC1 domain family member 2A isoform X3 [Lontra canadensis]|uniref:TBC1 domain family member 2A isoform X3 n=1 Tax=Lontra canadensis TaxID=76717 RepID=UPI0013F347E4|nr:TBC1 domain family member 2A isoform X3 [Lontra canadensis]
MEGAHENPAESSSSVPNSEEPAGLARGPEVLPREESEGCARPLDAAPKKLCGYLSKFGGKGPIRGWKSRWFFYDEKKCHLYYSRTAQDANPLDSIDLSSAVFDCKADAEEGTFEIKTPSRVITLKSKRKRSWRNSCALCKHHPGLWVWRLPCSPHLPCPWPFRTFPSSILELKYKTQCTIFGAIGRPKEQATDLQEKILPGMRNLRGTSSPYPPTQAPQELVRILHKALEAAQQEKRASSAYLAAAEDKDRLELVRHKVRQIAELGRRVEALEQERESLVHTAGLREQQLQELQRHVQLLVEKNQAKQQVICKLSEQVTRDFMQPPSQTPVPPGAADRDFLSQQEKMEHLKDDMEAYRTQNRFLNSEIHQVTKIWRRVAEKEKALLMKCAYLQAKNCQVESKYLAGLRRLQEASGGECAELLRQLIQEALRCEAREASAEGVELSPVSEYDEYGFLTVPNYEMEDLKLLAKIQALEVHSHYLLAHDAVERPLRERWAALGDLAPSAELKQLLRAGVPREHRPRVWKWLVHLRVRHLQSPGRYQALLSQGQVRKHPAARQIELDLNRTFPNNKHFTCPTSSFPDKLRRVLLAFSWQNPTIGYCQGLNRLAAIALLVLEEEESAFWCLVAIVETIMPADYYSKTLTSSQVDHRVLQDLLLEKLPRLMAHLGQHRVDLSFLTFNWFLVVFADSLISNILLRVWDAFLYEGTKVIFRYALAIFKYNEEEILRLQDALEIYQYLRFFTRTICNSQKLMHIAFNDMNPFPMKQLRQLRTAHRERLEAELRELEQLKAEYLETRNSQGPAVPGGCASEDEGEGEA